MKQVLLLIVLAVSLSLTSTALADPVEGLVDGAVTMISAVDLPAKTEQGADGRTIDVVGDASNTGSGDGRAKGNAYRVDGDITLDEAEFWLNFTSTQVLAYYVFSSPVEFGTYTEICRDTETVTGSGAAWYSTGTIAVPMYAGTYYIIAVSWDGSMVYYYATGDSQSTSFGAYVHGYAIGYHPLPSSFSSTSNDQAIYYQRLMTTLVTPVERSTWGGIKSLFR